MKIGTLGCIGVGAMGTALIAGVLEAELVSPPHVVIADADAKRVQHVVSDYGVREATNVQVAESSETVIVAVKPDTVPAVLDEIAPHLRPGACVVSVAAGVPLSLIEKHVAPHTAAVRAMPNTPCLVGAGAVALARGTEATDEHVARVAALFGAVGETVVVAEQMMDAVTGLSGSGPAYVYLFIEALADGGVGAGLPRDVALRLAAQTVRGAAEMVMQTGRHPGELKDMVTSPAGTTIAGVGMLEDAAFRAACMRAVKVAARRSRELGQGAGKEDARS